MIEWMAQEEMLTPRPNALEVVEPGLEEVNQSWRVMRVKS